MVENQVTATLPQKEIREACHSPAKLHLHWETHALKWTNLYLKNKKQQQHQVSGNFKGKEGRERKRRGEEKREGEGEGKKERRESSEHF